ncbi:MAG: hypothetical protein JXQ29_15135 [Planctomycetes bacterium]|nr:hypothetical protein [Planctomycetota bacterium]
MKTAEPNASPARPASEPRAQRSGAGRPDVADFILLGTAALVAVAVLIGLAMAVF